MNKFILILLIMSLYGCSIIDDDTNNICPSDCTTLQGRFITQNNVGLKGVKVLLKYRTSGGALGGGSTRLIVDTQTDENGNFYKEFYINNNELGATANGYFKIEYDDTNLDVNKYILSDNQIGNTTQPLGQAIYSINTRDTIIGNTYYLPKKSNIAVNLNNFVAIQDGDYFEVRTRYPFGAYIGNNDLLDTEYSTGFSGWGTFQASELNSQLNPFVAENEQNIIRIARRKNGVNTVEDFTVFVPSDNSIELTYEY
jgi:hypothetical protein